MFHLRFKTPQVAPHPLLAFAPASSPPPCPAQQVELSAVMIGLQPGHSDPSKSPWFWDKSMQVKWLLLVTCFGSQSSVESGNQIKIIHPNAERLERNQIESCFIKMKPWSATLTKLDETNWFLFACLLVDAATKVVPQHSAETGTQLVSGPRFFQLRRCATLGRRYLQKMHVGLYVPKSSSPVEKHACLQCLDRQKARSIEWDCFFLDNVKWSGSRHIYKATKVSVKAGCSCKKAPVLFTGPKVKMTHQRRSWHFLGIQC